MQGAVLEIDVGESNVGGEVAATRGAGAKAVNVRPDVALPLVEEGWALVRVLVAGVCGTDLEMIRGYKGGFEGVIGHEFVGEVERIEPARSISVNGPSSSKIRVGDRVVGEINIPCEASGCTVCQLIGGVRKRNHCPDRRCLGIWGHGGAFAERLSLPIQNLFVVSSTLSDEVAAFAEPVAAACRVLEQLPMLREPGKIRVCVVGDGRLGLLVAAVLAESAHATVTVEVLGRHEAKLGLLVTAYPRLRTCIMSADAVLLRESSFDVCVEATGSHAGLESATRLVRPLGTLVLKSTCAAPTQDAKAAEMRSSMERESESRSAVVVKELVLLGSRCGPFPEAVALMTRSAVLRSLLGGMVQATYPLAEMEEALAKAGTKGVIKVQLRLAHRSHS